MLLSDYHTQKRAWELKEALAAELEHIQRINEGLQEYLKLLQARAELLQKELDALIAACSAMVPKTPTKST